LSKKKISRAGALLLTSALAMGLTSCADIQLGNIGIRKRLSGELEIYKAPQFKLAKPGVKSHWAGLTAIDLPLEHGTEEDQHYVTKDNKYITLDMVVYTKLAQDTASLTNWFYKWGDKALDELAKQVDGIARSTVLQYERNEIANENLAKANGKLPIYQQVHVELYESDLARDFGVNNNIWYVCPGNISPQRDAVFADLERQRNLILREARNQAQNDIDEANKERALVDAEYNQVIGKLHPVVVDYLATKGVLTAARAVTKKADEQHLSLKVYVE